MDKFERTLNFYETNVEGYVVKANNISNDLVKLRDRFLGSILNPLSQGVTVRILDAGCGSGRDSLYFYDKCVSAGFNAEIHGIDLVKAFIKHAGDLAKDCVFKVGDLRKTGYDSNYFDGVWACASLLHLGRDETRKSVSELFRVLKFGGVIFACVKEGKGEGTVGERHFVYYDKKGF